MKDQITQVNKEIKSINKDEVIISDDLKALPVLRKTRGIMPTRSILRSKVLRPKSCLPGAMMRTKLKDN